MKILGTVIKAVLVAYLVIFAVNNMQPVAIKLFFGMVPYSLPMFLFAIIVLFIGFLAGVLLMAGEKFSVNQETKRLRKELLDSQNEITRLKNITLTDEKDLATAEKITASVTASPEIKDVLR